jgi:hypothetical protein
VVMPAAGGAAAAAPAGAGGMAICCCIAGAGAWAYLAFVACFSRFLELVKGAEGLMVRRLPGVGRNFAAEYLTTWYECLRIGKEGKGRKGVRGPITGLPSPVKNETNVPWNDGIGALSKCW